MRKAFLPTVLILTMAFIPAVWAQTVEHKVAIAPLAVHSPEALPKVQLVIQETLGQQLKDEGLTVIDPAEVQRALTALRLERVDTESQARLLGNRVDAGRVIFGSFNKVGSHISIDAKLVDVRAEKKTEILVADEEGMENLAAAVNKIRQQVTVQMLDKAVIADIKVQGNERIEVDAIKAAAKSAKGEVLRPAQVREDIRAIYQLGFFEEVQAEESDSPAGKVLTFVVREKPSVQEVRIKGNSKIKEKDILAAIHTKPFTVLQRNIINDDVQRILKLYHEKAYFNAEVKTSIDFPQDPRKGLVTFNITENDKIYIKSIQFKGNKHYSARTLRGVMQTKEKGLFYWILDRGVLQDEKLNTDVDRLTAFYHDNGYMDAKVGTPVVSRAKDGFTIEIPVEEGERYRVAAVAVTGDPLETEEKLEAKLETKPKQYFSREKVRHDVEYVGKQYMDQGYAYAEVIPQVQRDPATHTTRVDLNVKRGNKVHIERISISGNTKTRDNVIRRQMKLAEGDLFSGSKLERSNLNLKKLDFFEQFEIVPSEGTMADLMNLDVKVKEKSTGAVSVGGGYSSDDGFFIGGEVFQRNLFGKGQSLGVRAHLGQEAQRYSLNFNDPNFLDSQYSAGFDIYKWDREYTDFDKEAQGVVLRFGHPVGNWSRVSAAYNFENATVSDVDPCASLYVREQEGTLNKSSVALSIERDTTDHPFLPTRGSINSAALELSSKYIGSDSNFASYVVSSAWYVPLVWKFIGFVRGRAGYISEFYGDDPVPIYERFFLGGVNSHRAFDWGELGPRVPTACDPDDYDVIGGTKFGLVNVELLFPLVEKLSMRGVLFFDAGNAFDDNEAFKVEDFRPGAGAGIVWASPFGPLRFYWAYNLDRKVDEDQYKFQFAMGYYF